MLRVAVANKVAEAVAVKGAGAEDGLWQESVWQYGIISLLLSPFWWRAILHNFILVCGIFVWVVAFRQLLFFVLKGTEL